MYGTPPTKREIMILKLLADGNTIDQIAGEIFCSPATVKRLEKAIYNKLGAINRAHAVYLACSRGIIQCLPDYSI